MGGAPPLYRGPTPAAQTYTFHGFRVLEKENTCRAGIFFFGRLYALEVLKASKIQTPPRPSQSSPERRRGSGQRKKEGLALGGCRPWVATR